jgi:mannose-6-phosphate isomerase-like protein (cupin superfamily)
MMKCRVWPAAIALVFTLVVAAGAQVLPQKPPAQTPPPAAVVPAPPAAPKPQSPAAPAAAPAAQRGSIALAVTDPAGEGIPGVHVSMTGPVSREGTTTRDGGLRFQSLRPGTYRLRFESAEFIMFEREVTVKAGPPAEVDVSLARAPEKPAPPPPAPAAAAPRESTPPAPNPGAEVQLLSLPDWIEKNLIGRGDAQKETVVGRATSSTASIVQVRDPIKEHAHAFADEMLYVIAGEGVLRANGREYTVDPGSLAVIPRGTTYSVERRGRNPLIALSIVGK